MPRFARWVPTVAVVGICLSPGVASSAHEPSAMLLQDDKTAQTSSPKNLKDALEQTVWEAEQRGPLIAFGPEEVFPQGTEGNISRNTGRAVLAPPGARGYGLAAVAEYFERRVVRLNSATVLAPAYMLVWDIPNKAPDPYVGMSSQAKFIRLLSLLSKQQWQQFSGGQGMGANDLTGEARTLFLSLLPDPFQAQLNTIKAGAPFPVQPAREVRLGDSQRSGIRLRMSFVPNVNLRFAVNSGEADLLKRNLGNNTRLPVEPRPDGAEFYTLAIVPPTESKPSGVFGAKPSEVVANRLKAGHLNFASPALDVRISLQGAKTLGELVKRVAAATRLDLVADPRVASLPLWVRGEEKTVRAGDLLEGMCWAVTGVFRKVGPVYILTEDIEGIGAKRARVAEWVRWGNKLVTEANERQDAELQKQAPLQYLRMDPSTGLSFDEKTIDKIKNAWTDPKAKGIEFVSEAGTISTPNHYRDIDVPLNTLSDDIQSIVRTRLSQQTGHNEMMKMTGYSFSSEKVSVALQTRVSYVVPGIGEIEAAGLTTASMRNLFPRPPQEAKDETEVAKQEPPVSIPEKLAVGGVLMGQPKTAAEAARFVELAKTHRFRQVWVTVSTDKGQDKGVLAAAVAAGKTGGVPVYAVARLMLTPSDTKARIADELLDRNILGETSTERTLRKIKEGSALSWDDGAQLGSEGTWVFPDTASVMPSLKARLREIAATPGLSGLVLRNTAAPGYDVPESAPPLNGSLAGYGYNEEMRLALIRRAQCDPIDLSNVEIEWGLRLGVPSVYFKDVILSRNTSNTPKSEAPAQAWNMLRREKSGQLLGQVYKFLKAEYPQMPVLLRDLGESTDGGWYGSWERAEGLPRIVSFTGTRDMRIAALRQNNATVIASHQFTSDKVERYGALSPEGIAPAGANVFVEYLREMLEQRGWDGYVFDFSFIPFEMVSALVKAGFAK
jgi:hypothetical protein